MQAPTISTVFGAAFAIVVGFASLPSFAQLLLPGASQAPLL